MKVLGYLMVVVEALIEIDVAIAIDIAQLGNLVTTGDLNLLIDNLDSQRLEHPRGDSFPFQLGG